MSTNSGPEWLSDLILELYGPDAGNPARSLVGMAERSLGLPADIEVEVEIHTGPEAR